MSAVLTARQLFDPCDSKRAVYAIFGATGASLQMWLSTRENTLAELTDIKVDTRTR